MASKSATRMEGSLESLADLDARGDSGKREEEAGVPRPERGPITSFFAFPPVLPVSIS